MASLADVAGDWGDEAYDEGEGGPAALCTVTTPAMIQRDVDTLCVCWVCRVSLSFCLHRLHSGRQDRGPRWAWRYYSHGVCHL